MPQKCSGLLACSFGWRIRAHLDKQDPSEKWVLSVFGPVWAEHEAETIGITSAIRRLSAQSDPKVTPKVTIIRQKLNSVGKMNVF